MVWRPFLRHLTQSSVRVSDLCGRLNSTWTVGILVLFAALTFYIQISSDPVNCWTPEHFTLPMTVYTNKVCGESNLYYFLMDEQMPINDRMQYAQKQKWRWLPLILLVQALLFKLPDVVLSVGQGLVGFRFTKIIGLTDGYESMNMADRAHMGKQVGRYLKSWIDATVMKGCPWGWLTLLFLFTKLLYFINIITNLSIMDGFLRSENQSSFGQQMYDDILSNVTLKWRSSHNSYSRVVLCDFQIRQLQALQRWTVQCTLNNLTYYEMMLSFIWLWLVVVSVITTLSGMLQLLTVSVPVFRKRYIKSYLHLSNEVTPAPSDNEIGRFAGSEITEDGVFILKAIGEASSEHLVRDAVIYLWQSTHGQYVPGPPEQNGPPPYLGQGSYFAGQTCGQGGTVISPPPAVATQQIRYRPQPGTEAAAPLMTEQPS